MKNLLGLADIGSNLVKRLTWIYIGIVSTVALLLVASTQPFNAPLLSQWKAFFALTVLSMAVQVISSAMPGHHLRIPHMIFYFTGVLLLPPLLFLVLIIVITLIDWEHNRREGNPAIRDKYLLPLRIGAHIVAAFGAYWILILFLPAPIWVLDFWQLLIISITAIVYAILHHGVGRSHSLVQGLDLQESGLLDVDALFIKVAMLFIGYGVAILWLANPWLLLIGLIPGLYYYQVHVIPGLKAEAYTDAKTGLSNMRHFDELFTAELARASRLNQPLSVIMVDVDDLGIINNTYGHLAGDGALITVSGTIRQEIGADDIAARLGGEEFAIVLPEVDIEEALVLAESLRNQIAVARFETVNQTATLQTTVSIGVATYPQHGITSLELIHSADVAMYQAKIMGKNRVVSAEEVGEILGEEFGHQESTEVLNYRAAFAPAPDGQSKNKGSLPTPLVSAKSVQTSSNVQSIKGQAKPVIATTEDYLVAKNPSLLAEEGPIPIDSSAIDSSATGTHRVPAVDVYQDPDHTPDHAIYTEPTYSSATAGQAPPANHRSDLHESGLHGPNLIRGQNLSSVDLTVTKYQSELQNGPPTTQVVGNNYLRRNRASKVHDHPEQIPLTLVVATTIIGLIATCIGLYLVESPINLLALIVFGLVALIVQLLQHSMYESSAISVSASIILAGTLVEGMPGLVTTCSVVVLVHSIQYQPALYKVAFNWASHIIAGLAPLLVYGLGVTKGAGSLPLMVLLTLLSAVAYYVIESGLIASAIGLAKVQNIFKVWNSQFRWLALHYIVAGFVALSMALAYMALGPWGIVAFAMPVLLIYFAQKQYVMQTEQSAKELNWMNSELSKANTDISTANLAFQRLTDELFLILSKIIDARDPDVHGHAAQVATYAEAIAQELGLRQNEIEQIRHGALLHDIGKLGIPEAILHKPGPLTDSEYETIKQHASLGADLLDTCQGLRSVAPYVRHHHEWWNGHGYPFALYQDQIPMGARILAICDAVEAMTSDRPYRKGLSQSEVMSELEKGKGRQFDPLVVDAFTKVLEREGTELLQNTAIVPALEIQAA